MPMALSTAFWCAQSTPRVSRRSSRPRRAATAAGGLRQIRGGSRSTRPARSCGPVWPSSAPPLRICRLAAPRAVTRPRTAQLLRQARAHEVLGIRLQAAHQREQRPATRAKEGSEQGRKRAGCVAACAALKEQPPDGGRPPAYHARQCAKAGARQHFGQHAHVHLREGGERAAGAWCGADRTRTKAHGHHTLQRAAAAAAARPQEQRSSAHQSLQRDARRAVARNALHVIQRLVNGEVLQRGACGRPRRRERLAFVRAVPARGGARAAHRARAQSCGGGLPRNNRFARQRRRANKRDERAKGDRSWTSKRRMGCADDGVRMCA